MVWETRTAGSDSNGGAFKAGASGTDRSQSDTAFVTFNGSTITATTSGTTTTIAITGYTVVAADVGNAAQVTGGTNFLTGIYEITAVDTGLNTWTFDRNCTSGAGTGMTGTMGGALATIGKLAGVMVVSNKAFIRSGTYVISSGVTFGTVSSNSTASAPWNHLIGYYQTRGDITLTANLANRPIVQASASGYSLLTFSNNGWCVENLIVDCNSKSSSQGIYLIGQYGLVRNCKVMNYGGSWGLTISGNCEAFGCEVTGGGSGGTVGAIQLLGSGQMIVNCWLHDNAGPGITGAINMTIIDNLITNNSGASSDAIRCDRNTVIVSNTIYSNGRHGINNTTANFIGNYWRNNILSSNGGYGLVGASSAGNPADAWYDGNAFWNNTSGARSNADDTGSTNAVNGVAPYINTLDVILTADPFVAKASNDFRLNNVSGGGAACRGFGVPTSWPGNSLTISAPDMGAVQHADPAASGGGPPAMLVPIQSVRIIG